jgi:hypothetical protein
MQVVALNHWRSRLHLSRLTSTIFCSESVQSGPTVDHTIRTPLGRLRCCRREYAAPVRPQSLSLASSTSNFPSIPNYTTTVAYNLSCTVSRSQKVGAVVITRTGTLSAKAATELIVTVTRTMEVDMIPLAPRNIPSV